MVALHGWKAGRKEPRASKDADILVNARVVGGGTQKVSETLLSRGFSLDGVSPEGIGHRFVKGHVRLDVLGPDGVGSRIRLQTVHGARTVEVPGGSQALKRTEMVEIRVGGSSGEISVPDILGAILVKVRAIEVDDVPRAQRADVAFLLSLVEDPDPLIAALSKTERRWLTRHPEFADSTYPCYQGIVHPTDAAEERPARRLRPCWLREISSQRSRADRACGNSSRWTTHGRGSDIRGRSWRSTMLSKVMS
jgi:hypothetical protein